jgi:hypothetical protein
MLKIDKILFLIILLFMTIYLTVGQESVSNFFDIYITDSKDKAVEGATVKVMLGNTPVDYGETDMEGKFQTSLIIGLSYNIIAINGTSSRSKPVVAGSENPIIIKLR